MYIEANRDLQGQFTDIRFCREKTEYRQK